MFPRDPSSWWRLDAPACGSWRDPCRPAPGVRWPRTCSLRAAHLFVSPSLHHSGVGVRILQADASRIPSAPRWWGRQPASRTRRDRRPACVSPEGRAHGLAITPLGTERGLSKRLRDDPNSRERQRGGTSPVAYLPGSFVLRPVSLQGESGGEQTGAWREREERRRPASAQAPSARPAESEAAALRLREKDAQILQVCAPRLLCHPVCAAVHDVERPTGPRPGAVSRTHHTQSVRDLRPAPEPSPVPVGH